MTETKKSIKNGNNKNKRTGKRTASKKTAARKTTAAGSRRISDSKKRISSKRRAEKKKRMFQIGGLVAGVVLVILLCSYVGLSASVNKVPEDKICDNVFIGTVEVSGMDASEAQAALEEKVSEYQAMTMTLKAEEASVDITLSELGFQIGDTEKLVKKAVEYGKTGSVWSRYFKLNKLEKEAKVFDVTYSVDEEMVAAVIEEQMPELEDGAKNATITRSNGEFVITDAEKGVAIETEESTKAIETFLNDTWKQESDTIELVTKIEEPEITREQLEQIQDVLGKYTTYCGTGGGRVQNIETGASLINGTVLMPGEEFSADAAMRPYTYENGYAEAGSYENGKVVQSMGGGICQVSSTLYNACILAELEITQRQAHSMTVGYVDPSMDAAIAGDYKDLKFVNSTETPIYIEGSVSGGYITFKIYGKETRPENRSIAFVSETLSTTKPGKKFVASSASLGTKSTEDSGHTGLTAQLWKVVYENGTEVSREVFNTSTYISSDATISVGTSSSNATASKLVKDAIATQNEDKINAAISQAKDVIAKEQAASQTPSTSTPSQSDNTTSGSGSSGSGTSGSGESSSGESGTSGSGSSESTDTSGTGDASAQSQTE